jgi:hypothetical protein
MPEEILVIPPIRQSLEDLNSAKKNDLDQPLTEKSWYLYWQKTGDRVNANTDKLSKLITYGNHADRPPADAMPAGSLYMETDRGNVIYQQIGGNWHYLAGTMFGTLSPDQRPTDLSVYDAGFDFRGTDVARQFLWSQTEWIETTEAQYGNHAARPNPNTIVQGALYCEIDRSGVLYQNIGTAWKYRAGTMYGTLVPDQRPTDLGTNDGGFEFRGTDQQRHFIWSQTVWIEVGSQTPWTGNIDGGGFDLTNVHKVTAQNVEVSAVSPLLRILELGTNKFVDVSIDSTGLVTFKNFGGSVVLGLETMTGHITMPFIPSSNPGAGTKKVWYDPADGNRMKYAP